MASKSSIKKINIALTIIILIISIAPIEISGEIYRKTDMLTFAYKGPWRHTAALQVSAVSVLFFSIIISFINFIFCDNFKIFNIIFLFIQFCSSLFCISIGIFDLVGSVAYNNELKQTCSEDYSGFFTTFRYMDSYFKIADQLLCSYDCPCKFNKIKGYDDFKYGDNGKYYDYFKSFSIDNDEGASNFDECKFMAKATVFGKINTEESIKKIGKLNFDDFSKFGVYFGRIENQFKCTAWCKKSYYDEYTKENKKFYKYLFSDVSEGVVRNIGCMNHFRIWLVKYLKAYGSLILIDGTLQFTLFILGILYLISQEDNNFKEDDDNNDFE